MSNNPLKNYHPPMPQMNKKKLPPPPCPKPPPRNSLETSPPSSSTSIPPEDPPIDQLARLSLEGMSSQHHHKRPRLHRRPSQATQRADGPTWGQVKHPCHLATDMVKSCKIPVTAENHFLAILALL